MSEISWLLAFTLFCLRSTAASTQRHGWNRAEKLQEGLVNATELKSFCANLCCESYPIPEKIDEMVEKMHKPFYWPAMKEERKSRVGKQRFGALPSCVHKDDGSTRDFQRCYTTGPDQAWISRTGNRKSERAGVLPSNNQTRLNWKNWNRTGPNFTNRTEQQQQPDRTGPNSRPWRNSSGGKEFL